MNFSFKPYEYDMLYGWFRNYELEAQCIARILDLFSYDAHSILELGCGTGNLSLRLASMGMSLTGIDKDQSMLNIAKKKARIKKLSVNLKLMNLLSGKWDGIKHDNAIAPFSLVFNFISRTNLYRFFQTVREMVNYDGLLIINGFNINKLIKDYKNGKYYSYGINPWLQNKLRTFVKVIYNNNFANLIFYHQLECLAKPIITNHTLRPYTTNELCKAALLHDFEQINVFGYPPFEEYDRYDSKEYYIIFKRTY